MELFPLFIVFVLRLHGEHLQVSLLPLGKERTSAMKTPMTAVASSGAELPAAMKVAPATSGFIFSTETAN